MTAPTQPSGAQGLGDALELAAHFAAEFVHLGALDHAEHGRWIHEHHADPAVRFFPHDDIAGQQRANIRLGLQGLMGIVRIAGPEDEVGTFLDAEFGLERGGHIDGGQYAEALLLQRLGRRLHGGLEAFGAGHGKDIVTHG